MKTVLDRRYQAAYTAEAERYDRTRFGGRRGEFARRVKDEVILDVLSDLPPEARVLDAATGTGRIAHSLLRRFRSVAAVDLTRAMLRRAARADVRLAQADVKRLAFAAETFDAVTLGSFLHLVPAARYAEFSDDIWRVLRPRGRLVCEIANPWTLFNPLNLARIGHHRLVRRRAVKSYLPARRIRAAFPRFSLERVVGVEYPLLGKSFGFYRFASRLLGRLPVTRGCGGRYVAVLRKTC